LLLIRQCGSTIRAPDGRQQDLLEKEEVPLHPFFIGEIAMGSMPQYAFVMRRLDLMPQASKAADDKVLYFIRQHKLYGTGIGYIDAHLLAAALLTPEGLLWTRDKRLHRIATAIGVAFETGRTG
jgi:predicted nucleic acid-binding protein